jgi:hypothetical protein
VTKLPFTQGDEQKRLEAPPELDFVIHFLCHVVGFHINVAKLGPTQGDQQTTGKRS